MDTKADIVFFSLSRFDDPISSPGLSLAMELSKNNRVFFIEQPFTWKDYWTGRNDPVIERRKKLWSTPGISVLQDAKLPKGLTYIIPPRLLPINFLPPGGLYDAACANSDRQLYNVLRNVIKEHSIKSFLFVNSFHPVYFGRFPSDIKPALKAYLCIDDISQVAYTSKHGLPAEERMIRNYDLSFATGKELQRLKQVHNSKTYYLPNASNFEMFNTAVTMELSVPDELKPYRGKKIIGFTGSVEYRTDFGLLKKMVEYHHDKIFVVVGPVYAPEIHEMGFDRMDNVVLTGAKHISSLPAYLQHMDVMIIPYALTTVTKSIYPLKINEYLGAGKPVVATAFSEDIQSFGDVAYIAYDDDAFMILIDRAIAENSETLRNARIARARQNTWAARVSQFWRYLDEAGF